MVRHSWSAPGVWLTSSGTCRKPRSTMSCRTDFRNFSSLPLSLSLPPFSLPSALKMDDESDSEDESDTVCVYTRASRFSFFLSGLLCCSLHGFDRLAPLPPPKKKNTQEAATDGDTRTAEEIEIEQDEKRFERKSQYCSSLSYILWLHFVTILRISFRGIVFVWHFFISVTEISKCGRSE